MNNRSSISVLERNLDYLGKIYGNKKEKLIIANKMDIPSE